jgi:hypothetical protein
VLSAQREGIAYVEAENVALIRPTVSGWWERGEDLRPDGPDDFTVTYQQWDDLDEGILWARQRSPRVSLRVEIASYPSRVRRVGELAVWLHAPVVGSYRFYSAGAEWYPSGEDTEGWPGAPVPDELGLDPAYGGVVNLASAPEAGQLYATERYNVRWEVARNLDTLGRQMVVQESAAGLAEDDAIAWGRARAAVVLVCLGGMEFQYFSAGEEHLAELDIPGWESRRDGPTLKTDHRGLHTMAYPRGRRFPIDGSPDPDRDGWGW